MENSNVLLLHRNSRDNQTVTLEHILQKSSYETVC